MGQIGLEGLHWKVENKSFQKPKMWTKISSDWLYDREKLRKTVLNENLWNVMTGYVKLSYVTQLRETQVLAE